MTDYFALLEEARRPWIDASVLKSRFLERSAALHPDRFHNAPPDEKEKASQRYTDLNTAYTTLREPRDRLLHLYELETGAKPKDIQRIPPGTMDLFVEVGQKCRDVDQFLKEKAGTTSPLLQVQMFQKAQEWVDQLTALQKRVDQKRTELEEEIRAMNGEWEAKEGAVSSKISDATLERLEQIYRIFSYIARWKEQIQERSVQLSF
jgi:curved DNA-binding protein CbpA